MARLRTLLLHSPGVSALAGMIALMAIAWAAPVARVHPVASEQARPIA
jgi:hypothetical protein